jgi:RNA ligase (TIGR02306 family)
MPVPVPEEAFVKIRRLEIFPHPNADALELAGVDGFRAIVRKGEFVSGDYAVYIPEKAIIPDDLLEEIGLTGRLSGAGKNRVKPMKIRGQLSEGIVCRPAALDLAWEWIGDDVTAPDILEALLAEDYAGVLGIEKWSPRVPAQMAGKIRQRGPSVILGWIDIPNIKKMPEMFKPDDYVIATEKIHGTHLMCTLDLRVDGFEFMLSSKGMGKQGWDLVEDPGNLYWQAARKWQLEEWMRDAAQFFTPLAPQRIAIYGEVYGNGIQDLGYGENVGYRLFDIRVDDKWLGQYAVQRLARLLETDWDYEVKAVPVLYDGPYDYETLRAIAEGDTVVGNYKHMREGLVVRPVHERTMPNGDRVIAKFISEKYLLRKDGSEFE